MEGNKFDSLLNSPAAPQDARTAAFVAESRVRKGLAIMGTGKTRGLT